MQSGLMTRHVPAQQGFAAPFCHGPPNLPRSGYKAARAGAEMVDLKVHLESRKLSTVAETAELETFCVTCLSLVLGVCCLCEVFGGVLVQGFLRFFCDFMSKLLAERTKCCEKP